MKFNLFFAFLIMVTLLLGGCDNNNKSQETIARTYYESLDLDTPEAAVTQFASAFQREDYETVYLIFSPSAQIRIANRINTIYYQELIKIDANSEAKEILNNTPLFNLKDEWEHRTGSYLFDTIMLAAKQHSAFLIDLSGEVEISNSEQANDSSGNSTKVDVNTIVDGIEGNVIFRMEQAPSGRWRVRQVIIPGGNEELIPWSVPSD
ncbi:MAG: hypothetical protein GY805_37320 [Chloroflexi bacterium]|nr:hypothetical protein [Chloroflexota bacterium]